jgi:hypothetical protein
MTEEEYKVPLLSFDSGARPKPVKTIPIIEEGRAALETINQEMGLGFDEFDLDYYTNLFKVRYWSVQSSAVTAFGPANSPCTLSDRRSLDVTLRMSNALTWVSQTPNTLGTGSSGEGW